MMQKIASHGVVIEQQRREADERQRLARQIAGGFRDRLLHLPDVVVDPRHQLAGGRAAKKPADWPRMCAIERVAQVHDHALADPAIRYDDAYEPSPFSRFSDDDECRDGHELRRVRQDLVEDRS